VGVLRVASCVWLLGLASAQQALGQAENGLELERRGRYEEAAAAYRSALGSNQSDVATWLGLERVLTRLGQLETMAVLLDSAINRNPADAFMRELELRVWASLGQLDSVAAAAERWMTYAPGSPDPYRHWALTAYRRGESPDAIRILLDGRARLGGSALAPDLAQMYVATGAWASAAEEWAKAVTLDESLTTAAVAGLRQAPELQRDRILAVLVAPHRDAVVHRLGAEVLVSWNRPEQGWTLLVSALPADRAQAASVLSRFVDRTLRIGTPEAARARGYALERLAELSEGTSAERARVGAAQAFADAGDLPTARRLLETLATADAASGDAASAVATLIRVTLESGKLEEADTRFRVWEERLRTDDAEGLRRSLATEWIRRGELGRAEQLLVADSSIVALAIRGWLALYRGDLLGATEYFRAAGPHARSREEATRRTTMLALLQNIQSDSLPSLGRALLLLEQGDTTEAVERMAETVRDLEYPGERAHLLAFAGRICVAEGDYQRAESLLQQALGADSVGSAAPAAEYSLALVYTATGRPESAVRQLEHLILSHSGSAVVPEARRLLDRVRGAIPQAGVAPAPLQDDGPGVGSAPGAGSNA
jgi:tetratricopeptide (TPR) repeat protein